MGPTAARHRPARRPTDDNVGVQYGFKALLAGKITTEEFVTINERVGGFDIDANVDDRALSRPTRRR